MFTKRLDRIQPSATLAMTAKAAELRSQGVDVLNFSVGEPDFNTPQNIIDAAKKAVKPPTYATTSRASGVNIEKILTERYTPAATIVAACMRAETGVGPSIASGSHM